MTVTVPTPLTASKAESDLAGNILSARLRALGIVNFTLTAGDLMTFTMQVPLAIGDNVVDAVLHRPGLFQFVPWPPGQEGPAPGDPVPPALQPLFDDPAEFQSAVVSTDSTGQPAIDFTLGAVARDAIADYTTQHIGSSLPFVLDGFVLTAPTIQSPIADGLIRLTGPDPSPIPLSAIVAMIASGPLPAAWR